MLQVYGICDGVLGLMAGRLKLMDWPSVTGWVAEGGAKLGTKRAPPSEDQLPAIAQKLKEFGIQALLIIGGFEVTRIAPNVAPFNLNSGPRGQRR